MFFTVVLNVSQADFLVVRIVFVAVLMLAPNVFHAVLIAVLRATASLFPQAVASAELRAVCAATTAVL